MNPSSSSSSSSSSSMCEDIVIEILSRLPTKSLVRFMSVCRLWKSIITSPQFRLASNRPTRLLVHTKRECYTLVENEEEDENIVAELVFETDFPHLSNERAITVIVGSDNGLICINDINSSRSRRFIIWNPCIRKHVVIPDYPDRGDCVISNGFGATNSGLDYKLVRIVGYTVGFGEPGQTIQKAFHIYSLKAGTWRRFYLDYDSFLNRWFGYLTALLRGRLHWVVSEDNSNYISTFDLEDEVFENKAMTLPGHLSTAPTSQFRQDVSVIKGSLLAVVAFEFRRNCSLWVMQKYGDVGSWVKLWNIDQTIERYDLYQSKMVGVLKNGNLLLKILMGQRKFVTCDPKTMKINDFVCGVLSPSQVCGFTNNYKESLVLLADDDRAVPDHKMLSMFYDPSPTGAGPLLNVHNAPIAPMFFHTLQDQYGYYYYYVWTGFHWTLIGYS